MSRKIGRWWDLLPSTLASIKIKEQLNKIPRRVLHIKPNRTDKLVYSHKRYGLSSDAIKTTSGANIENNVKFEKQENYFGRLRMIIRMNRKKRKKGVHDGPRGTSEEAMTSSSRTTDSRSYIAAIPPHFNCPIIDTWRAGGSKFSEQQRHSVTVSWIWLPTTTSSSRKFPQTSEGT